MEQNGDGLLEDSHMPVGWPLHIDGAVRQCCMHRAASSAGHLKRAVYHSFRTGMDDSTSLPQPAQRKHSKPQVPPVP